MKATPVDLFVDDAPKYLRIHENPDNEHERYTVVFVKRPDGPGASTLYSLTFGEEPGGLVKEYHAARFAAKRDAWVHAGHCIRWAALPVDCRRLVLSCYCDLWGVDVPPGAPLPRRVDLSAEQVSALQRWLMARQGLENWPARYSLGLAYLDDRGPRNRVFHTRRSFVSLDQATARLVPVLIGVAADKIAGIVARRQSKAHR